MRFSNNYSHRENVATVSVLSVPSVAKERISILILWKKVIKNRCDLAIIIATESTEYTERMLLQSLCPLWQKVTKYRVIRTYNLELRTTATEVLPNRDSTAYYIFNRIALK